MGTALAPTQRQKPPINCRNFLEATRRRRSRILSEQQRREKGFAILEASAVVERPPRAMHLQALACDPDCLNMTARVPGLRLEDTWLQACQNPCRVLSNQSRFPCPLLFLCYANGQVLGTTYSVSSICHLAYMQITIISVPWMLHFRSL